ncbi:MAG: peptide chain release factor 2 [Candidatus Midichloria mitochondrii]|nr:peptide chain release factor 2 [Candidatus Midichloria mitochondrii]MDJ1287688.1 peptide chain release factor 2 [Candidatus Midichloria mitochondrii]MDJ1298550.1 peptide chain release factor 2 [Candidatus Midichloria mitochondrii]MDJ1312692.1 peptide chain release factor 2 [Candidatus Midichloria mitochondrii]MDJ1583270.1 peptide chain release factor 2 [Candidatus Midichloria mitochondrii]
MSTIETFKKSIENTLELLRRYLDWDNSLTRLQQLNYECEQLSLWSDQQKTKKLLKERDYLEKSINGIVKIEKKLKENLELYNLASEASDQSLILEIDHELEKLSQETKKQEIECLFSGEADNNGCFAEIHSGAGGTESNDWAAMLLRMYLRWIEQHKFKSEIIDQLSGEEAGIKSCTIKISSPGSYGWLKNETGIHRLVRISPFNSAGKRHTSFASIFVYPVVDEDIQIKIKESELRIDTYRASGAGGQHVNTTDSAVRIIHLPTGIVVQSQSNRSQHRNRDECFSMLKARLYDLELKKKEAAASQLNASKTGISWGHQIRSYVLHPYRVVKDLRTGHQETDTTAVLDGDLDKFMYKMLVSKATGKGLDNFIEDLD